MTPFEEYILKELRKARQPVRGTILAQLLGRPQRTTAYYLRRMESAELVWRPYGHKGGYIPRMA